MTPTQPPITLDEAVSMPEPIAYLKFWAYQQVSQDGNVNADDGLEVCSKGEIGADGVEAIPVFHDGQLRKYAAAQVQSALSRLPAPEVQVPMTWQEELRLNHPKSDPQYWPDSLMFKYCRSEVVALRVVVDALLNTTPQPPIKEIVVNADYRQMWVEQIRLNQQLCAQLSATPQPALKDGQTVNAGLLESMDVLDGFEYIQVEYSATFGRVPDAFMARVVAETKERLFSWWAAHREEIHEAIAAAKSQPAQDMVLVPIELTYPMIAEARKCTTHKIGTYGFMKIWAAFLAAAPKADTKGTV